MGDAAEVIETAEGAPEAEPETDLQAFERIGKEIDAKAAGKDAKAETKTEPDETEAEAAAEPEEEPAKPPPHQEYIKLRKDRQKLADREARFEAAARAREAELAAIARKIESHSPERIRALRDAGSYDEIAKILGAKDWEDLQGEALKQLSDPGYKQRRSLEERVAKYEAEREQEREAQQREAQAREMQAREQRFIGELGEFLGESEDPVVQGLMGEDKGMFLASVMNEMKRTRCSADEASEKVVAIAKKRYAAWNKIFGSQPTAQQAEAASAASPDRAGSRQQPAKPSKHVTRKGAASTAGSSGQMSEAEFDRYAKAEMERAMAEDIKNGVFS